MDKSQNRVIPGLFYRIVKNENANSLPFVVEYKRSFLGINLWVPIKHGNGFFEPVKRFGTTEAANYEVRKFANSRRMKSVKRARNNKVVSTGMIPLI